MKYNCDAKEDRLTQWHDCFAWTPIRIGPKDCRWWEVVERKGSLESNGPYWRLEWEFEYRSKS